MIFPRIFIVMIILLNWINQNKHLVGWHLIVQISLNFFPRLLVNYFLPRSVWSTIKLTYDPHSRKSPGSCITWRYISFFKVQFPFRCGKLYQIFFLWRNQFENSNASIGFEYQFFSANNWHDKKVSSERKYESKKRKSNSSVTSKREKDNHVSG